MNYKFRVSVLIFLTLEISFVLADQLNGRRLFYTEYERRQMELQRLQIKAKPAAVVEKADPVKYSLSYGGYLKTADGIRQFWRIDKNGKSHEFSLRSQSAITYPNPVLPAKIYNRQGDNWIAKESKIKIFKTK